MRNARRISGLSKCFVGTDMQIAYQFSDAWASHPIIVTRGLARGLKSEVSRKQLNKIDQRVRNDPLFEGEFGTHNGKNAIKITHVNAPRALLPLDALNETP